MGSSGRRAYRAGYRGVIYLVDLVFGGLDFLVWLPRSVSWPFRDTHEWERSDVAATKRVVCPRCGSSCVVSGGARPSAREAAAFGVGPDCDAHLVERVLKS